MTGERGRPRCFDEDDALDRALEVFWRHGFQSATLSQLTAAMGLNKPSLYAAFGDKEALYLKALARYTDTRVAKPWTILDKWSDARRAMEAFLRAMADLLTDDKLPGGCFVTNGAVDCGGLNMPPAVELALRSAQQGAEQKLRAHLQRARREGQLAAGSSVEDLTALFSCVLAGMGVLAKSSAPRTRLHAAINAAMCAWPAVRRARTRSKGPRQGAKPLPVREPAASN